MKLPVLSNEDKKSFSTPLVIKNKFRKPCQRNDWTIFLFCV